MFSADFLLPITKNEVFELLAPLCVCHCSTKFNSCIFKDLLSVPLLEDCGVFMLQGVFITWNIVLYLCHLPFPAVLAVPCNTEASPGFFGVFFPICLPLNFIYDFFM